MSIKILKLVSGEEILCTAKFDENNFVWELTDAVQIVMQQGPQDPQTGKVQLGFAFVPWGSMVDGPIHIENFKVIYGENAESELVQHYEKMFSKIITPPSGIAFLER